jgi:hypothetical protein
VPEIGVMFSQRLWNALLGGAIRRSSKSSDRIACLIFHHWSLVGSLMNSNLCFNSRSVLFSNALASLARASVKGRYLFFQKVSLYLVLWR